MLKDVKAPDIGYEEEKKIKKKAINRKETKYGGTLYNSNVESTDGIRLYTNLVFRF